MIDKIVTTLATTNNKFPEALTNEDYRSIVKKNIISYGTDYLLGCDQQMSRVCAVTLILIDSYDPSNPVPKGKFDARDATNYLRDVDIICGCQRSLVMPCLKKFVHK